METFTPPRSALDLSTPLYFQLVYTLTDLLPPPLDDTPEALHARNHAAIAKVAALLPVNANEADLAAQCVAARGQAEDLLRLLRQHAGDIGLVMRLNAQYGSMVRTSLSVHGRLMRVQAVRQKREKIDGAANEDAWAQHVAERSMLAVVDSDAAPLEAAWPKAAPVATPPEAMPVEAPAAGVDEKVADAVSETGTHSQGAAFETWLNRRPTGSVIPVEAPAACMDQRIADNVSETGTNSHQAAFETWLNEQSWTKGSRGSGETDLREVVREAMAKSRSASSRLEDRKLPANGRESPGRADYRCHIDGETAST